ncbi:MAG: hypothetical protein AABX29_06520 [Nanoarchaeota archaeon]
MESKFYRWYDEPDDVRIKLEDNYRKDLIERAIKKAEKPSILAKKVSLDKVTIFNYLYGNGMSVGGLKKILDFLEIKHDRINHKVQEISWNFKPNIKLNTKEIAILLAASLADGHLNNSHFMYKNKDKELRDKVENNLIKVFGNIKVDKRVDRHTKVPFFTTPVVVRRVLEKLGSPRGKKLHKNPKVPEIIMNGTREMKKEFIQQFFDDEGWCEKENTRIAICQAVDCTAQIPIDFQNKMELKKFYTPKKIPEGIKKKIPIPNLLKDIQKLLKEDFGIQFNFKFTRIAKYKRPRYSYISAAWDLQCHDKKEIKKFEEKINFGLKRKRDVLNYVLNRNRVASDDILLLMLNNAIIEVKKKGFFKSKDIAEIIDLPSSLVRKRLNVLVRKGLFSNKNGTYTSNLHI